MRAAQFAAEVGFAQGAGEQLQQAQMLVGPGGDTDGEVDDLPAAPVHPLGELQQAHAGVEHQVTGLGGAMGNGDTLAEEGRALGFASLQAGEVARRHQAIAFKPLGEHPQRAGLVRRDQAHGNLPCGQFEHRITSPGLAPFLSLSLAISSVANRRILDRTLAESFH
ncbi:hypothetical protein D3C78_1423370 [compost metagenome]